MPGNCEYRDMGLGQWHKATLDHVRQDGRIDLTSEGLALTRIEVWTGPRGETPRGMAYRDQQGRDTEKP